jgi:hypothetical protein
VHNAGGEPALAGGSVHNDELAVHAWESPTLEQAALGEHTLPGDRRPLHFQWRGGAVPPASDALMLEADACQPMPLPAYTGHAHHVLGGEIGEHAQDQRLRQRKRLDEFARVRLREVYRTQQLMSAIPPPRVGWCTRQCRRETTQRDRCCTDRSDTTAAHGRRTRP